MRSITMMSVLRLRSQRKAPPINAEVIKGIQTSLAQRDKLKKVGMTRPYPMEWDLVLYPPKFKPPTLHTYDGKGSPNQHIYYSGLKSVT